MRKLFTDHAVYTNKYTIAAIENLGSAKALLDRLIENQQEIGAYIGQFLGKGIGNEIAAILTEHIQLAGEALKILINKQPLTPVMVKITANVAKFATAMSVLTGNLADHKKWYDEFLHHNELVLEIAKAHLIGLYMRENELYDGYYTHMLHFSDMMRVDLLT